MLLRSSTDEQPMKCVSGGSLDSFEQVLCVLHLLVRALRRQAARSAHKLRAQASERRHIMKLVYFFIGT